MQAFEAVFKSIVALAGLLATSIGVYHAVRKGVEEWGLRGQQEKELRIAKARIEIWNLKLQIEEASVSGELLQEARNQRTWALNTICRETDENLRWLSHWSSPPPRENLSPLARTMLFYKPQGDQKLLKYFNRLLYWGSLCAVVYLGYLLVRSLTLLRPTAPHSSVDGRIYVAFLLVALFYLIFCVAAFLCRLAVLREDLPAKMKDIQQI